MGRKKYTAKELEPISRQLLLEEMRESQQLHARRLEMLIEEDMYALGQRMWRIEQNQEALLMLFQKGVGGISGEVTKLRKVPKDEAKATIKNYVLTHPGRLTSQIIEDLRFDPEIVMEALKELTEKGEIKGEADNE